MPLPRQTLHALSAHDVGLASNEITRSDPFHTLAHLFDDAAPLVADDTRRADASGGPRVPFPDVIISTADARSLHADLDCAGGYGGFGDLDEIAAGGGLRFGNGFHADRFSFRAPLYSPSQLPGGSDPRTTHRCCNMGSVERRTQLLPNHDFREALNGWKTTGQGATLIRSGGTQLVSLVSNGTEPVAVTSGPVDVAPAAAYRVAVEAESLDGSAALRVAWMGERAPEIGSQVIPLDSRHCVEEVVAPRWAKHAFVGVGTLRGSLTIRSVSFEPVGPRLAISEFHTLQPVVLVGQVAELRCVVSNTGSEALAHPVADLRSGRELLAAGVEPEKTLPSLLPGESVVAVWAIAPYEPGLYGAVVRVRSGRSRADCGTDVVASDPPVRAEARHRGVWIRRSTISVATPSFRMVLPRSELGFGAGQFELGDPLRFAGWIRSLATALGEPGEPPRALYGKRSRVEGTSLTMCNHDQWASWSISVTPKPDRSRLALCCRYEVSEAHRLTGLQGPSICLPDGAEPTDYAESETGCAMTLKLSRIRYGLAVHWPKHSAAEGRVVASRGRNGRLYGTLLLARPALRPGVALTLAQEIWMGRASTAEEALER